MSNTALELKMYPIGKFIRPDHITDEKLKIWIKSLEELPSRLARLISDATPEMLERQYRPDSWTVRQIIHHLPDSHMNGYIRLKLALTEDNPTIKPYDENGWTQLADVQSVEVDVSLELLKYVHIRWVALAKSLNTAELRRTFYHPENKVTVTVADQIGLYAWHGEHHLRHVREALGGQ